jgi:3-oxoadipate CoA-transferase beta subunit
VTEEATLANYVPHRRRDIAARVARDIQDGWYVNLGIGMPTQVADFVGDDREVVFHSENGLLGMGPAPTPETKNPWLINAGKQYVTLKRGGSYVHHADSFAMIRGGHLDLCVLGAFEVSQRGDLANWSAKEDSVPAVGGAMDLAVGAKRIWIMMDHLTREGEPKLVRSCSYPLTAAGVVSRIYTNLAVLEVIQGGFRVVDMVEGLSFSELKTLTAGELIDAA